MELADKNSCAKGTSIKEERLPFLPAGTIRSVAELTELLDIGPEKLVDRLKLRESEIPSVYGSMNLRTPRWFLNQLIVKELSGHGLDGFFHPSHLSSTRVLLDRVDTLRAIDPFRAKVTVHKGSGLRGFPCEVREIPAEYCPYRPGMSRNSTVLALQMTEKRDWETVLRNLRAGAPPFVQNTFGFIRFEKIEVTNKDRAVIVVSEFRNDLYERLRSDKLIERYKDWPKIVLHCLEGYLQSVPSFLRPSTSGLLEGRGSDTIPSEVDVLFPPLKSIDKRWSEHKDIRYNPLKVVPSWPRKLRRQMFREIPKEFGYKSLKPERPVKIENVSGTPNTNYFVRGLGKTINLRNIKDGPENTSIQSGPVSIKPWNDSRIEHWIELRDSLFQRDTIFHMGARGGFALNHPTDRRVLLEGQDISKDAEACFQMVPAQLINIRDNGVASPTSIECFESGRNGEMAKRAIELTGDHFTFMSRGKDLGSFSSCWKMPTKESSGWTMQPVHLKQQNRHPSLRLVEHNTKGDPVRMMALGIKGGGVFDPTGVKLKRNQEWSADLRLPIYYRPVDEQDPAMANHHMYWGGMTTDEAYGELATTLAAHEIVDRVTPHCKSLLPTPIGIFQIQSLPMWDGDKTTWMGTQDYCHAMLNGVVFSGFATLNTLSRCDVRIGELVGHLFTKLNEPVEVRKEKIDSALNFLYWINSGEKPDLTGLTWPADKTDSPLTQNLKYIHSISEKNAHLAQSIFKTIREDTLSLLGVVHGAGGTLGGGSHSSIEGAPFGGAVTLRNMDLTGGLHDIDGHCFFPWLPRTSFKSEKYINSLSFFPLSQSFDLIYWRESMYWLQMALLGNQNHEATGSITIELAPQHDINFLESKDPASIELRKLGHKFRKEHWNPISYVPEDLLQDIYWDHFVKGKDFYR